MSLNKFNFDFDDEDDDEISDLHYNFSIGFEDGRPKKYSYRPTISYKYLDLGITEFSFNSEHLDANDAKIYFEKMLKFSKESLDYLIEHSSHDDHFKISPDTRSHEYQLLNQIVGTKLEDETTPVIGHFALYTTPFDPSNPNLKSPRIFFFVGNHSVLHILFFDPFHKIHPMGQSTRNSLS